MRGVKPRPPPFGWDPGEEPRPGYRARKRLDALTERDEMQPAAPALRFLRGAGALKSREPAPEPTPPKKRVESSPLPRRGPIHERSSDATAAARQRLHRERARSGRRIVPVAIDGDAEELLRACGVLQEWDTDNRAAVGHAVERLLELLVADSHT